MVDKATTLTNKLHTRAKNSRIKATMSTFEGHLILPNNNRETVSYGPQNKYCPAADLIFVTHNLSAIMNS